MQRLDLFPANTFMNNKTLFDFEIIYKIYGKRPMQNGGAGRN